MSNLRNDLLDLIKAIEAVPAPTQLEIIATFAEEYPQDDPSVPSWFTSQPAPEDLAMRDWENGVSGIGKSDQGPWATPAHWANWHRLHEVFHRRSVNNKEMG